ncbi:SDR family NAD(P)-dependent oxidoreductase [Nocardia stercoris]|uniref:SDR family NAD(P)-dependent oxidoreductase n=1 Tax=Nocardia stercoris TaxID=2483361 RepID=A0A3M2KSQ1_9NOCA|nr:SDR family NAD(P)-dependent oxidoreductase [Nocardia stercoris]
MQFEPVVRALVADGYSVFVEASPHPLLTNGIQEIAETGQSETGAGPVPTVVGTLRRDESDVVQFLLSAAAVDVAATEVDWGALWPDGPDRRVDLPTYAFQHRRYWIDPVAATGDARSLGVDRVDHPLLGAVVSAPEHDGLVVTGRLSLQSQPWLADHAVGGVVLFPGTGFVELAVRAGDEAGFEVLRELTLGTPLVLPPAGAVQIRIAVAADPVAGDPEDTRAVTVYSRSETADADWILHAQGVLTGRTATSGADLATWPPADAVAVPIDELYDRLAEAGYGYGPAFQGLRAVWRRGAELFAEVVPAEEVAAGAERYGLHPALLDAVLHAVPAAAGIGAEDTPALPFSWADVTVHATGAAALRARITSPDPDVYSIEVADRTGRPVLSVGALTNRPMRLDTLTTARDAARLHAVNWSPLPLPEPDVPAEYLEWDRIAESDSAPATVVLDCRSHGDTGLPAAAHDRAHRALAVLQEFVRQPRFESSRLLVVTSGAVSADPAGVVDPAGAAVWGLVRSAQAEEDGRIVLADTDGELADTVSAAVAANEPQLLVRDGTVSGARLTRLPASAAPNDTWSRVAAGTVVITGGTGGLGALTARHLVTAHGVPSLVLAGRRGLEAPGAPELAADLTALGARVLVLACDISTAAGVAELLAAVPAEFPLTGVVHAAGVLDDGMLAALTPDRIDAVFGPKADAAWFLHEATRDLDLGLFALFSSLSGTLAGPGQGNYAAANTVLDALAAQRRAQGLVATSIAWGLWSSSTGMTAHLAGGDTARINRGGVLSLSDEQGLALFDAAVAQDRADVVAARFDVAALAAAARSGGRAPLLRGLVPGSARAGAATGIGAPAGIRGRLSGLSADEQLSLLVELVREQVAAVLGHDGPSAVAPDRNFADLGFDSLTAVEARNRLKAATDVALPATLVFDYPTPGAVAEFLRRQLAGAAASPATPAPRPVADEPIAIVGMSCRYPGGVTSAQDLWELVLQGRDVVSEFPADRGWDVDTLFDPDPDVDGKSYVRDGGFLYDAGLFDAAFFGISPREAVAMDPQQRLLLETMWEGLEDTGIDPKSLRGTDTGVFVGAMYHDYPGSGASGSILSGRVSYTLGLEGPSVTVDTACSSSLVALHQAVAAVRAGECGLALVGGVTVMATPGTFVEFSRQRGLAPDGRSKSFADAADGATWSEGVGVLVVERLSEAQRRGHRVLAIVRGTAVNQDGASNGLTAPNGPSQQRVIRQALANAGLTARDVQAVEGHGTGTRLGDPIEAQALLATYGRDRPADRPLWLGSLKSNIGHTQAAAGVAGVIKMVQAMRHRVLPRTLHVDRPSSHVEWDGSVELLTEQRDWDSTGPRRAGVSSFGISGTNAHVILEEAAADAVEQDWGTGPEVVPWVVSARTPEALVAQASRLAAFVSARPELDVGEVAWSLVTSRAQFDHRAVVVGASRDELLSELRELANSRDDAPVPAASATGAVALVFPGQGAQWAGMGRELAEAFPVFATAFDEAVGLLEKALEVPVREVLWGSDDASADNTMFAQAGLFAVGVGVYHLLESWGVTPDVVAGHSIGEIGAAYAAGVLTLADAAELVAARGRLMAELPAGGAMVAVAAGEEAVREVLRDLGPEVAIAAVNGPRAVVISGAQEVVEAAAERLRDAGHRVTELRVSHAFHSPLMDPMLAEFGAVVAGLTFAEPRIPLVSTVTGEPAGAELLTPDYWVRHVRETVRFADGVRSVRATGAATFVVAGPDGGLSGLISQIVDESGTARVVPVLRRRRVPADTGDGASAAPQDRAEVRAALAAAGELYTAGIDVNWAALWTGPQRRADLPTYAFQRSRYWLDTASSLVDAASLGQSAVDHPLLGAVVTAPESGAVVVTGRLSLHAQPWLADHAIGARTLFPATGFVELAIRAGAEAGAGVLRELGMVAPLVLPAAGGVRIQVVVGGADGAAGIRTVSIYSHTDSGDAKQAAADQAWVLHAQGVLGDELPGTGAELVVWPPAGAQVVPLDDESAPTGYRYGPVFQGLRAVWRRGDEVFADVALPADIDAHRFGVHPALVDAALRAALVAGAVGTESVPVQPDVWQDVRLHAAGAATVRARITVDGDRLAVDLADRQGAPVLSVGATAFRPVSGAASDAGVVADACFVVDWVEAPQSAEAVDPAGVAVLGARPSSAGVRHYRDLAALIADLDATAGAVVPEVVVLEPDPAGAEQPLDAARRIAIGVLDAVQGWLADPRFASSRLVVVSRNAVSVADPDPIDPAQAPVWGLLRAAQAEHPGRFGLLDVDDSLDPFAAAAAVAVEPEAALRGSRVFVPRLRRYDAVPAARPVGPGTVLVTGGTGGLGALIARHLVTKHGVRHLVLASRRGPEAPGAAELRTELAELGAEVALAACDVSDREALAALIGGIPAEHPLVGVVHAAGIADHGLIESITADRLDRVLRAKADAAWHLHELTREHDLSLFVLLSSAGGLVLAAGQADYAAANVFLDALAAHRRQLGLPGTAVDYGMWERSSALGADLSETDFDRMRRQGFPPLSEADGLALLDAAITSDAAQLVASRVDRAALRARGAEIPALARGLVPVARHVTGAAAGPAFPDELAALPEADRPAAVLDMVRSVAARILGHPSTGAVAPQQPFKELGFDSLTAVQARNRLNAVTGLTLPATLVFDYPTPQAVADYVLAELTGATDPEPDADAEIRAMLNSIPIQRLRESGLLGVLGGLASGTDVVAPTPADSEPISAADMDEEELINRALRGSW